MKIAFVCNWGEGSKGLLERYKNQTPGGMGIWKDIEGVDNPAEADVVVAMDGCDNQKIDKKKIIFFQREPEVIRKRTFTKDCLFNGDYDNFYQVSNWWIDLSFNDLVTMEYPEKTKDISCIMSNKVITQGQRARLDFLRSLSLRCPKIEIYGRGSKGVDPKTNKGEIKGKCKSEALRGYRYSLACENVRRDNYFTEKIVDCFLMWTKPIYWGCSNLDKYFPSRSYVEIDVRNRSHVDRVIKESSKPIEKEDIEALKEARELVLSRYNIWPSIKKVL